MRALNSVPPAAEPPVRATSSAPRASLAWVLPVLVWLGVAATAGIAFWSAPRGFDFLDTGCYFLEYKFPDDVADTHTTYRLFARPFFLMVGGDITAFRVVSWFVVWISAGVLAWGWWRHMGAIFDRRASGLTLVVTSGLFLLAASANYTIKPAALTYNSLNFVGVCFALGLLFDASARFIRGEEGRLAFVEVAVAALVATVDLLIKPTTAAFLVAVICGYCAVSPGLSWMVRKRLALLGSVAGVLGLIVMIVFVGGVGPFLTRVQTLTGILENQAYMDELNTRTLREFREIGAFLAHDLRFVGAALAIACVAVLTVRRSPIWRSWIALGAGIVVFGLWSYSTVEAQLWRGSHQLYFEGIVARLYLGAVLVSAGAVVVSILALPRSQWGTSARELWLKLLVWLILVATPFAGAYGSTTTVYLNGALYAICWLGATLLALLELARIWGTRWLMPFAAVPISVYAVAQLYHGQIQMPYMNPSPLWEQKVPTAVGQDDSMVLLDPAASEFINRTREILQQHGFQPGDDIFCFFNVPGLVYAVGGRSPIIPWYFGRIYVGNPVEELFMQRAGPARREKAWIITQAEVTQFREHFHRGGIPFPEAYEEIGELKNPQSGLPVQLWKRRAATDAPAPTSQTDD